MARREPQWDADEDREYTLSQLYTRTRRALRSGQIQVAAGLAREAAQLAPNTTTVEELLGDVALAQEDYEQAKVQVDRMAMKSPVAGRVEFVYVEAGESVEALGDVVRLVKTDPLWTDVPVPLARARHLKLGDTLQVVLPEAGAVSVAGKIIHIAAVADAAAETLTIRLEVPNPKGRPAGERIRVLLPGPGKVAAAKRP